MEKYNNKAFLVSGKVKIFPLENPWIYVEVPKKYTAMTAHLADRGLVAITVTLGSSKWDTSLMPMGDGSHFIALNAKVRKKENISVADSIKLSFTLRTR